jgi:hypothetical protein
MDSRCAAIGDVILRTRALRIVLLLKCGSFFLNQYQRTIEPAFDPGLLSANIARIRGEVSLGLSTAQRQRSTYAPQWRLRRRKTMATPRAGAIRSKAQIKRALLLLSVYLFSSSRTVAFNPHTQISQFEHTAWGAEDGFMAQANSITQMRMKSAVIAANYRCSAGQMAMSSVPSMIRVPAVDDHALFRKSLAVSPTKWFSMRFLQEGAL